MSYRRTEIVVGAFLLMGVGLVMFGIWQISGSLLGPSRKHYSSYANVNTIQVGSAVKYNGMLIGRVSGIAVDPERPARIRVDLAINDDESIRITDRMEAKITKADLLGDEYIDIRVAGAGAGSAEAMAAAGVELEEGSAIPAGEPFDLQRAMEGLQATLGRVDLLLDTAQAEIDTAFAEINSLLTDAHEILSPETLDNIASAVEDVAATTAELRTLLGENSDDVETIMTSVGNAAGNLDALSTDLKDTVAVLRPDIEALTGKVESAITQLDAVLATAGSRMESLDVAQVNEVMENLDTVSRNLIEFTDEIKQRPYRLIRKGKQPPKEFR